MQNEERKSLRQQIAEGKALKLQEYQEKFESKNTTYILDEKAVKFYNELKEKEQKNDKEIKQLMNKEMRRYQSMKESKDVKQRVVKKSIQVKKKQKITNKPEQSQTKSASKSVPSVVGDYSSDEDV
ncbi:unnamed protein product [Candida verbasci]|uniref:FAM192A/Fyv6 N-terminal domain-containing protein n=1 Tax=Candida verbasci TaxID=1227364 RepID=A0A9W4XAT8_9ASCO|nr:unnamed protein product [Candida verbasci]